MPIARPGENRGGVGDPVSPDQWFNSLPFVTKYWFGATVLLTLSVNFQIVSAFSVLWSWPSIRNKFELWRLLTPFCYAGPFSPNMLILCYLLVQFSKQYESGTPYNTGAGGGTADYAFCILLCVGMIMLSYPLVIGLFPLPPIFCENLVYSVVYLWSKRHSTSQANIWGFPVPALYLPFVYLALRVVMGGDPMTMLHGMAAGHIYYFMVDVVPMVYGKDILRTPQFLIDYFGIGEYQSAPAAARPAPGAGQAFSGGGQTVGRNSGAATGGGGHNWGGSGRALGRS